MRRARRERRAVATDFESTPEAETVVVPRLWLGMPFNALRPSCAERAESTNCDRVVKSSRGAATVSLPRAARNDDAARVSLT